MKRKELVWVIIHLITGAIILIPNKWFLNIFGVGNLIIGLIDLHYYLVVEKKLNSLKQKKENKK